MKLKLNNPLFIRYMIIAAIGISFLLPLYLLQGLINERTGLYNQAIENISQLWGSSQTITGPFLIIPYVTEWSTESGAQENHTLYKIVLPKKINFIAEVNPKTLYRGIYSYEVYQALTYTNGDFELPAAESFGKDVKHIYWDRAFLNIGISEPKGIKEIKELNWGGESINLTPGGLPNVLFSSGFHSPVRLSREKYNYEFSFIMTVNGSKSLSFSPVGETTTIKINANFPTPQFNGVQPAEIQTAEKSYLALWNISNLSRPPSVSVKIAEYSQNNNLAIINYFANYTAGVKVDNLSSPYLWISKAAQFGLLFIGLVFAALLLFEFIGQSRLHPLQYAFVGITMFLFYLELLSLSEHLSFIWAFLISAFLVLTMNGLYVASALHSKLKGGIIALLLAIAYFMLYVILQYEGHSLLVKANLLVILVGILMYLTRNLPASGKIAPGQLGENG